VSCGWSAARKRCLSCRSVKNACRAGSATVIDITVLDGHVNQAVDGAGVPGWVGGTAW
jgi:hypothetical protein